MAHIFSITVSIQLYLPAVGIIIWPKHREKSILPFRLTVLAGLTSLSSGVCSERKLLREKGKKKKEKTKQKHHQKTEES